MFVTVQFPAGIVYPSSHSWFIDPADNWTIMQLCDDVAYASRVVGDHKLQLDGSDLNGGDLAAEALSDGATVALVPA